MIIIEKENYHRLSKGVFAFIYKLLGYKYVVNFNSRQIHRFDNQTAECKLGRMTYWVIADKGEVKALYKFGFDPCDKCNLGDKK